MALEQAAKECEDEDVSTHLTDSPPLPTAWCLVHWCCSARVILAWKCIRFTAWSISYDIYKAGKTGNLL